ncbi:Planctomycete cytochrome C [Gimesia chilikensis]|uniref:Planctomycete cytochrome C n=1 Tax=Gimesia chilikensis TaxID=2605989 RepID=A0A517WAC9_9PLAN|nr:PSD1 and planctomycete cytochrome C domain-containing protein [Gimesia chilikensis]QDU02210.1 Planctomycete cytochrome C [Gimesia chilikensis]
MQWPTLVVSCCVSLYVSLPLRAETPPVSVDYAKQIKPLLKAHCFACHGVLKQESALRLDAGKFILKGGEIGKAVVPGNSAESLLFQVIGEDPDFAMPPEGQGRKLTPEEVALIRTWIDQGAQFPAHDSPEPAPTEHWAFQPVKRPEVPKTNTPSQNPIDAFLLARQLEGGLTPQPQADKATRLRRLYLDLIGLPPRPTELTAFLNDTRPDAWQRVIDDLLSRPQYGERWGRHWMDVWRYSDWYGRRGAKDMTNSYSLTWRWRDWIIRSLNEDKAYDVMVRQMLAADELAPNDRENLVATGFIVRNFYRWNYHTWLKDNVEHTAKAFLGLTMNCCECHDHKYDPISQEEYFAFRSLFEPIDLRHDRVPGEADPGPFPDYKLSVRNGPVRTGMVRIYDRHPDALARFYTGGLEQNIVKDKPPIEAGTIQFLGGDEIQIQPVKLPATAWYPGLKPFVIEEETQTRTAAVEQAQQKWDAESPSLEQQLKEHEQIQTRLLAEYRAWQKTQRTTDTPSSQQTLQLTGGEGRRALARELTGWNELPEQLEIHFQLRLHADKMVNFQLSNDLAAGRTNLYVAFEAGNILTYAPGTTNVTTIGSFPTEVKPLDLQVDLQLQPAKDIALLTVIRSQDHSIIIKETPIALNGWNPANSINRGLFLDAHAGSRAEFDHIVFLEPGGRELNRFDFEFPDYAEGADVTNATDWILTRFSTGNATSKITLQKPLSPEEQQWQQKISAARQQLSLVQLKRDLLQAELEAARAELAQYQVRVDAARARHIDESPEADALARAACQAEWKAKRSASQQQVAAAALKLHTAQLLPETEKTRSKQIQDAQQQLTQARTTLSAAEKPRDAQSMDFTPLSRIFPQQSSGRRAALAQWITSPDNPLTARVAVNHIWMRHFGQPLVDSVYNFGRSGAQPTHPQLIDWLAAELMAHDWKMKHIHRLILSSDAYQRSSKGVAAGHPNLVADRDNRLLWKFPLRRMEAEIVRDSLFYLADDLDTTMFGQEIEQDQGLTTNRRSLYYSYHGEAKMEFLALFDGPSSTDCYRRQTTVRPQQALALTNSQLALNQGRRIAARLWSEQAQLTGKSPSEQELDFIRSTFELILARAPNQREQSAALRFLEQQQRLFQKTTQATVQKSAEQNKPFEQPATDPAARARESLVQALFNHNDFVTIR